MKNAVKQQLSVFISVLFFTFFTSRTCEALSGSTSRRGGFCKSRQQQLKNRQFTEPAVSHQAAPSSEGKAQPNGKQTPGGSKTQAGRSTGRAGEAGQSYSSTNSGLFVKGRIS